MSDDDRGRVAVVVDAAGGWADTLRAVRSLEGEEGVEVVVRASHGQAPPGDVERALITADARVIEGDEEIPALDYRFEMSSDETLEPGALDRMAARITEAADASACQGRVSNVESSELLRTVPAALDPFRVAYANEYPAASLFRRQALLDAGGWRRLTDQLDAQSDWSLWMTLAEQGARAVHLGDERLTYVHFRRAGSLTEEGRAQRGQLRAAIERRHAEFLSKLPRWRERSTMSRISKLMFPVVYGRARRFGFEATVKSVLDRTGIWTQTAPLSEAVGEALAGAQLDVGPLPRSAASSRIAVITPSYQGGEALKRALRSIREPQAVEVIVVDDGSTDPKALRTLDELEAGGVRVVRHETNQGVSASRTTGLAMTTAPFVFPLDSDDVLVPGVLTAMLARLEREPGASVCFGNYAEIEIGPGPPGAEREAPVLRRSGAAIASKVVCIDEPVVVRWSRRAVR